MDVDDAAAGEDLVELVALQLVVAGAAAHYYGFDVQVVQRVGHAVKQHPVVGDDLVGLVELATAALGVAAAQITRWQHSLHARVPQHGLGRQPHLAEQPLRPAAWEIKHRFGFGRGGFRVANDRDVVLVFDVQQCAGGFLGQAAGHFFVDEVNHLLFDRRLAHGGGRRVSLLARHQLEHIVGQALGLEAHVHHRCAHDLDGLRVGRVQKQHGRRVAGAKRLLPHLAQQVAHVHRHLAEVDVDRARRQTLVAHGAVVGHVLKLFPVLDADAAPGLFFVQKRFDQQRRRQNLVARAVEQIGTRHVGGAHRLALAAAQAVLDRIGNRADVGLLHDERLMTHQAKTRRVGVGQIGKKSLLRHQIARQPAFYLPGLLTISEQLAFVKTPFRVHLGFVVGKRLQFGVAQKLQLGDANAVLPGNHTVQ